MPFKSKAQRRWMYANHPEMAARWSEHTPKGTPLPDNVKDAALNHRPSPPMTAHLADRHASDAISFVDAFLSSNAYDAHATKHAGVSRHDEVHAAGTIRCALDALDASWAERGRTKEAIAPASMPVMSGGSPGAPQPMPAQAAPPASNPRLQPTPTALPGGSGAPGTMAAGGVGAGAASGATPGGPQAASGGLAANGGGMGAAASSAPLTSRLSATTDDVGTLSSQLQRDFAPPPTAPPAPQPTTAITPQPKGQQPPSPRMPGFKNPMPGSVNPLGAGSLSYGGKRVSKFAEWIPDALIAKTSHAHTADASKMSHAPMAYASRTKVAINLGDIGGQISSGASQVGNAVSDGWNSMSPTGKGTAMALGGLGLGTAALTGAGAYLQHRDNKAQQPQSAGIGLDPNWREDPTAFDRVDYAGLAERLGHDDPRMLEHFIRTSYANDAAGLGDQHTMQTTRLSAPGADDDDGEWEYHDIPKEASSETRPRTHSMPHEGIYNGKKVKIIRGPQTQVNGKFSGMGRGKRAMLTTDDLRRLGEEARRNNIDPHTGEKRANSVGGDLATLAYNYGGPALNAVGKGTLYGGVLGGISAPEGKGFQGAMRGAGTAFGTGSGLAAGAGLGAVLGHHAMASTGAPTLGMLGGAGAGAIGGAVLGNLASRRAMDAVGIKYPWAEEHGKKQQQKAEKAAAFAIPSIGNTAPQSMSSSHTPSETGMLGDVRRRPPARRFGMQRQPASHTPLSSKSQSQPSAQSQPVDPLKGIGRARR